MAYGTSRPPVSEGMADAITRDIKSNEGRTPTSEIPLAFQLGRQPVDPAVIAPVRRQMTVFGVFALGVLAILITIWWAA